MARRFNVKDIDGRWFHFDHQERRNSCVAASVKIAKQLFHNHVINERVFQGVATLFEKDARRKDLLEEGADEKANRIKVLPNAGISPISPRVRNAHDWTKKGLDLAQPWSYDDDGEALQPGQSGVLERLLRAQPLPIPSGRVALASIELLRAATRTRPALIAWHWPEGGYHCTVCVGPTQRAPDQVVILDPANGLRYVDLTDLVIPDPTKPEHFKFTYNPGTRRAKDPFCPKGDPSKMRPPGTHTAYGRDLDPFYITW